ncbi:CRISPR-associated helicase Cas3' [Thermus islandicus]|uniref:CRISPR-associated helicase Cas3' n=1 Tax=Thermus islandicus TaxID=540988 RepID=UPI0003B37695|nr:CRISPR-associated helicase Cas3' [Thermus islandicus]
MGEGIGRVFFLAEEVGFQPLSHHQGLVVQLLKAWREGEAPLALSPKTKERLFLAAEHHDDGKRLTFRITEEKGRLTYSFRGHRFRIAQEVKDPYAQALIRGHHDYSTPEVVSAASDFVAEGLAHRFPEDLFLLMMADQLEAELAVRLWEGKAGEVRSFVEFDLFPDGEDGFFLDPWPFREDEVLLDFLAYFHPYRGEEAKVVEGWGRALVEALEEGKEPEGFQRKERRVRLRPWAGGARREEDAEAFYAKFSLKPTPFQKEVFEIARGSPAHLLLAPTGTGKTEAAAFPALARGERLVFVLPTRSLVDDLEERFRRYLKTLAREEGRPQALVVDTGHRQVRFRLGADGQEEATAERHLYHADVILTTLDKLLYRYFGYAAGAKSYTFPRRIHDRRTLFVFDEVHLYEATAWVNFRRLIASLYKAGVRFLVMSATMPNTYTEELLLEGILNHPQQRRPSRVLHYCPQGDLPEIVQKHRGKRILVALEEVKEAVEVYRRLRGEGVFLYHGRLAEGQRRKVFAEVKRRDKDKEPYILITTPAIEVGVDLDAEVLISTLCPPENLMQRLGRVNRRGEGRGEAYVVGQEYPQYLGGLPEGYVELLKELDGTDLAEGGEERLREAIRYPRYLDLRAETLFEALWEYVYGLDLTQEPLHRKGFVATRSWTPSVRLRKGEDEVEVPIDRLIGKKEELTPVEVVERRFTDGEEGNRRWKEVPLRSGELYGRELVVDYPYEYDPELGFVELPKVFLRIRHPDPQRVQLLFAPTRGIGTTSGEVLDSDQISEGGKRVLWYLGESAEVEPVGGGEEAEEEEEEEET